jgi:spore coat protein U-like protein
LKKLFIISISVFILTNFCHASDTSTVSVRATVVSRGYCQFDTSTSALNFGNLDPSNPRDITATTTITYRCFRWFIFPVTFFIGDDDGLYEIGPNKNRMRHHTILTEFIPYSFDLNPTSGTIMGNWASHTLTLTGSVRGPDYENAATGRYTDTVTITIIP